MKEFIYKLNLPSITDVLLPGAFETLFKDKGKVGYQTFHPKGYLKPEWLTFNSMNWEAVSLFYKNNYTGDIHIDEAKAVHAYSERANFAINWIHGGEGTLEYWLHEDVKFSEPFIDPSGVHKRIDCFTDKPPFKTYNMSPGAYLVNTSITHRGSGTGERYAFSMRSYTVRKPWDNIVSLFENYIIK